MNKSEKIIVAVLCVFLLIYIGITSKRQKQNYDDYLATQTNEVQVVEGDLPATTNTVPGTGAPDVIQSPVVETNTAVAVAEPVQPLTEPTTPLKEEVKLTIKNDVMAVDLSSHGGGVTRAELFEHRETIEKDSGNLVLDFTELPALTYTDIPGLGTNADFTVTQGEAANVAISKIVNKKEDHVWLLFSMHVKAVCQ